MLSPHPPQSDPLWSAGSAVIGGRYLAKFGLSGITARRRWKEAGVLRTLRGQPGLCMPELVAAAPDPVHLVTRLESGGPLSVDFVASAIPDRLGTLAGELARFLVALHRPATLGRVTAALGGLGPPDPPPQATTDRLRRDLPRWLRPAQVPMLQQWCDWTDATLARPGQPDVFVHGDMHGYNQVWDHAADRLVLVVDLETSGAAEPEYDLRYVPSLGPGTALLTALADAYERHGGGRLDLNRVMAWHARSHLGDALWHAEDGLPLPDGGTPADYADALATRFAELGLGPRRGPAS